MQTVTVTIIYFERSGIKVYVKETAIRDFDEKLLPIYTENKEDAHQFESDATEVEKTIANFHNPYNRVFKTESFVTKISNSNSFAHLERKDALV